ncbi:enoyl-CoA hydratase/isomerase family protein [Polaromonas sp.]|uniref:enoyl-CoA hydratase/isomerase family protein n=1 Tax=Polaromonas sp. TaxID=1869339 RepID=UPI00334E8384
MSSEQAVYSEQQGEVVTLTLNRPDRLNALDHEMAGVLLSAIEDIARTPSARVLVLRGEGKSFCAGGDVAAMQAHRNELPAFIEKTITPFHACILGLQRLPMPVVACAHGALAGGGFSLAMACDFVVATRSARFVVAYPKLGAPADGGLSFFLVQRLGAARGLEALTTKGQFDAETALRLGLVNRVVDDDRLAQETNQWVAEMLALPPQSLRELKTLVAVQSSTALQAHLQREKEAFLRCAATPDFAARVAAFAQKRQPRN